MAFQGSLKELPLPDIIQLVSVSGKTGVFSLRRNGDNDSGEIYLRGGQIVHARVGDLQGEEAMYELAIWPEGEFVFTPGKETELTTIQKSNTNLLMEAARRIDEWQILSKRIPSTRLVPVFTQHATTTSVSLTPQEWAAASYDELTGDAKESCDSPVWRSGSGRNSPVYLRCSRPTASACSPGPPRWERPRRRG